MSDHSFPYIHLKPNSCVIHTGIFKYIPGVKTSINSLGYRGKLYPPAKNPNSRRIIILGDSFTFCPGLKDGDDYPSKLEKYLSLYNKNYEVLNFGIPSHNMEDISNHLETEGVRYQPDIIILQIADNDFSPSLATLFYNHPQKFNSLSFFYLYRCLFTLYLVSTEYYDKNSEIPHITFFLDFIKKVDSLSKKYHFKILFTSFGDPLNFSLTNTEKLLSGFNFPYFPCPNLIIPYLNHDLNHLNEYGADLYAKKLSEWIISLEPK